jgi:RND family efflux transporter MFP subunit
VKRQDQDLPSRWRNYVIAIIVLLALALVGYILWQWVWSGDSNVQSQQRPPVTVAATDATTEIWQTQLPAVGTLDAVQGVEVTTEATGIVEEINFESGERVEQGELLVKLLSETDLARLERLREQLEQAQADLTRNRRLRQSGVIAEATFEESETAVETLEAEAQEQQQIIDKKSITAPFTGDLGIRRIDLGEFVAAGQPVVLLQAIEPIYVNFYLPEQYYQTIATGIAAKQAPTESSDEDELGLPVEIQVDAYPNRTFEGRIDAVSPRINRETRNFQVQAILPNKERLLRPGMFAQITVIVPDQREVTVLPATAISYNPYGDAVFLIRPMEQPQQQSTNSEQQAVNEDEGWFNGFIASAQNLLRGNSDSGEQTKQEMSNGQGEKQPTVYRAQRAFVTTGERRDTKIEILKGVDPGERVVTAGQLKLEDGAPIVISPNGVGPRSANREAQ